MLIIALTWDSWNSTVSPSTNWKSFLRIYVSWVLFNFSAQIATVPLVWPINNSPIINSEVVPEELLILVRVISGAEGLEVPADS